MSKTNNRGFDRYGTEPFEQQQFGTAGTEWVKTVLWVKGQSQMSQKIYHL